MTLKWTPRVQQAAYVVSEGLLVLDPVTFYVADEVTPSSESPVLSPAIAPFIGAVEWIVRNVKMINGLPFANNE